MLSNIRLKRFRLLIIITRDSLPETFTAGLSPHEHASGREKYKFYLPDFAKSRFFN